MADEKLSELPVITGPLQTTDQLYVVRVGVSYQATFDDILTSIPPSGAVWGSITGDINDQTDLATILSAKVDTGAINGNGQTMVGPGLLGSTGIGVTTIVEITIGAGLALSPGGELSATAVSAVWGAITGTLSDQTDLASALSGKQATGNYITALTGDVTASGPGSVAATLANTAVTPGSYTLASITVDSKGRITAASNGSAGSGTVTSVSSANGDITVATGTTTPVLTLVSAPKLTTARNINGVAFDGTGNITVTAAAGTLTGTTLASNVVTSSLTAVGDLVTGSIGTGFVVKGVTMTLGSDASYDVYYRNSSGVLTRLGMGTTGQFLAANTGAAPTWGTPSGSGTVTNTGTLTSNAVVLGNGGVDVKVVAGITTDGTSMLTLGVNTTTLGKVKMFGNTSGDATVQPAAVAGTATVVTLPNASSTLPIFSQQITFSGPTAARTVTMPDASFTVARTDAANTFTGVQTMTSPAFLTSITLDGVNLCPQILTNPQSAGYTAVLGDANKAIVNTAGSTATWTIPANGSVAYPIGTTLTFVMTGTGSRTIAITTDTMYFAGSTGTGSRTLAGNGIATAYKFDTTSWVISGTNLT